MISPCKPPQDFARRIPNRAAKATLTALARNEQVSTASLQPISEYEFKRNSERLG
jgi:hypothetical protein